MPKLRPAALLSPGHGVLAQGSEGRLWVPWLEGVLGWDRKLESTRSWAACRELFPESFIPWECLEHLLCARPCAQETLNKEDTVPHGRWSPPSGEARPLQTCLP